MANNYDFNANMDFILNHSLSTNVENNIDLQSKILDSDSFNNTFKYIEDSLNFLYEKNRTLQDLIKYSKTFLTNEINSSITDCKTLLQSIEDDKDLVKDKTYIKYSVPFYFGLNNIIDRDNSIINTATVYDGKLTLADNVIASYLMSYFAIKRSQTCIYSNEANYLTAKNYRSLYAFKAISSAPIEETITFKFNSTVKLNKLKLNLSNCKIKSVTLNLENNKTKDLDIDKLNLFETQYVDSVSVIVSCSNYSVSQTNYSDITSTNFTSIINDVNTDTNSTVGATKYYYYLFGIDSISAQYVTVYEKSGFYSKEVSIGKLNTNEHLTLYAEDSVERGSIEYYIINGSETIPMLPENQTQVVDEKIFYKSPTRFTVDTKVAPVVKMNNEIVNVSLYDAINTSGGNYTVSYVPVINTIGNLINDSIKIKVIIRSYDTNYVSFINNIKIKKYGGNNLWTV
jgi:hypothetical protein